MKKQLRYIKSHKNEQTFLPLVAKSRQSVSESLISASFIVLVDIFVSHITCNGSVLEITWNLTNIHAITQDAGNLVVQVRTCFNFYLIAPE